MENRNALVVGTRIAKAMETSERKAAAEMVPNIPRLDRVTVGKQEGRLGLNSPKPINLRSHLRPKDDLVTGNCVSLGGQGIHSATTVSPMSRGFWMHLLQRFIGGPWYYRRDKPTIC